MRLLSFAAENFGSYKELGFRFDDLGLGLISGSTGSGKSTLYDAPCWTLYGETAKGGSVEEVKSWQSPNEATKGVLTLDVNGTKLQVTRIRGKHNENDLYWIESGEKIRGKDLTETQKLLNQRLNCDIEHYLSGAYSSEFSSTGQFFTAKTKDRKALFEKIANLSWVKALEEKLLQEKKVTKSLKEGLETQVETSKTQHGYISNNLARIQRKKVDWHSKQSSLLLELDLKNKSFENDRETKIGLLEKKLSLLNRALEQKELLQRQIKAASDKALELKPEKCNECGSFKDSNRRQEVQARLTALSVRLHTIEKAESEISYTELSLKNLRQMNNNLAYLIEEANSRENPYEAEEALAIAHMYDIENRLLDYTKTLENENQKFHGLVKLLDLASTLKTLLLQKAVQQIETSTNGYLERYFDSEIKVKFTVDSGDDLNVEIQKSGNDCVYSQLSKGQRGLLKLCFTVSVMEVSANNSGIHFNALFFDESLDGLDSDLKVKAFGLFEELSTKHETVLLIDHSQELQQLFTNKYEVTLNGEKSEIKKA